MGTLVRTRAHEVSSLGRNTQGVRIVRTRNEEKLVRVAPIDDPEDDDGADAEDAGD
jgi:DNA gyrase subunit A